MESKTIETFLKRNHKNVIIFCSLVILVFSIYKNRNIINVMYSENSSLRKKVEILEENNMHLEDFKNTVIENANLVGRKLQFFDQMIPLGLVKLVSIVKPLDHNHAAEFALNKLVTSVNTNNKYLQYYYLYDHGHQSNDSNNVHSPNYQSEEEFNYENMIQVNLDSFSGADLPVLFVIGKSNETLLALTFSEAVNHELKNIKDLVLRIIKDSN